jgi:hypothetical protein
VFSCCVDFNCFSGQSCTVFCNSLCCYKYIEGKQRDGSLCCAISSEGLLVVIVSRTLVPAAGKLHDFNLVVFSVLVGWDTLYVVRLTLGLMVFLA